MHRSILAAIGLVLVLSSFGCGRRSGLSGVASTTIYHPHRVPPQGAVISVRDPSMERRHGLGPGTLQDTVEMVHFDPNRVCVRMSLWALPDDLHRADFARYEFTMSAGDAMASLAPQRGRRNATPTVAEERLRPLAHLQVLGASEDVHTGRETLMVPNGLRDQCTFRDQYGYCRQWDTQLTHRGVRVDADVRVRSYVADLCFTNQGLVTDGTRQIVLEMRERRRARQFVWQIDPSAPMMQPQQQAQAPGAVPAQPVQQGPYGAPPPSLPAPQGQYAAMPPPQGAYIAPPPAQYTSPQTVPPPPQAAPPGIAQGQ